MSRALATLCALILVGTGCGEDGEREPGSAPGDDGGAVVPDVTLRRVWSGDRADAEGQISPDGRLFTYAHPSENLTVRWVDRGEERLITSFASLSRWAQLTPQPLVSDDGVLAFVYPGAGFRRGLEDDTAAVRRWRSDAAGSGSFRSVFALDLDAWRSRPIFRNEENLDVRLYGWTPDGERILAGLRKEGEERARLALLPYEGHGPFEWGVPEIVAALEGIPAWAAMSPDGRRIAFDQPIAGGRGGDIHVASADGRERRVVVATGGRDRLLGWGPAGILYETDASGRPCVRLRTAVEDGASEPDREIRCDVWGIRPMGFTRDGRYWYGVRAGERGVYTAELDLDVGRLASRPVPVSHEGAVEASSVRWSPSGEFAAYVAWSARNRGGLRDPGLFVRSLRSGDVRRYAPELDVIHLGTLRWSPGGGELLFSAPSDPEVRPPWRLHRLDLATGEREVLPPPDGLPPAPVGAASWAPDGTGIASTHGRGRFVLRDRRGRELRRMAASLGTVIGHLLFVGSDDIVYADRGRADRLFRLDLETGENRLLWWMEEEFLVAMDMIPGTRELLVATGSVRDPSHRRRRFWRLSLGGSDPEVLPLEIDGLEDFDLHPDGRRIAFTADRTRDEVWVMEGLPGGDRP